MSTSLARASDDGGAGPVLALDDVRKDFGPVPVLRGVTLRVRRGEKLVVIGPSGGGKSTLLRCINLLEPLDGGRITFNGRVVTERGVDANAVRRRVGMVFQQFDLFPHLRVLDNLTLAPRHLLKERTQVAESRAHEHLTKVGLADKATSYPHQLSGGEQQRVAIARALMMDPEVMLFDEVTSALDPELAGEVLATIRELAVSGMTMVIVTHEMQFACEVGDHMAFIADGVVVEEGPPRSVLVAPQQERTSQFLRRILRFHDELSRFQE